MRTRILIVDDEETIRKLLKSRLERDGYEVVTACNADEAQTAYKTGDFGVVVTDLRMPGKDGFALLGWVRENYPNCCGIVITGHGEKEAAIKAIRSGAS